MLSNDCASTPSGARVFVFLSKFEKSERVRKGQPSLEGLLGLRICKTSIQSSALVNENHSPEYGSRVFPVAE
jgi:hypothetical protein